MSDTQVGLPSTEDLTPDDLAQLLRSMLRWAWINGREPMEEAKEWCSVHQLLETGVAPATIRWALSAGLLVSPAPDQEAEFVRLTTVWLNRLVQLAMSATRRNGGMTRPGLLEAFLS